MKIRWFILFFPVVSVVVLSLAVMQHKAKAAAPQMAAAGSMAKAAAKAVPMSSSAGPMTIPDTTLAVNSDKPMSERVVHYEIDAHYDAVKHVVNADEVLTYHNLTGQALD